MAMKVRYTVIDGEVVSESRGGVERDYISDVLGNTIALVDNTGAKTDTFEYFPSGTVSARTGTTATPFQWNGGSGYYRDSSSRSYVRARHLSTSQGKWQSQDPIGFDAGDYNLYRYVGNNFTNMNDPSGLECKPPKKPSDPRCEATTDCDQCKKRHHMPEKNLPKDWQKCLTEAVNKYCGRCDGKSVSKYLPVNNQPVRCMIHAESTDNPNLDDGTGPRGLMQIKKSAWDALCADLGEYKQNWKKPCKNIECGVKILCSARTKDGVGKDCNPCGPNGFGTDCRNNRELCCCMRCS